MKQTFTGKVRLAIKELDADKREIRIQEIAENLDLVSDKEKRLLYHAVSEMRKRGEITRIRPGVLLYKGADKKEPQLQQVMWRILRARKSVTIADLQKLAGASYGYAKEWLGLMRRRGIVSRTDFADNRPSKWTVIKDTVKMPQNHEKAERLRGIRAQKKEALEKLDDAYRSILEARIIINSIAEN